MASLVPRICAPKPKAQVSTSDLPTNDAIRRIGHMIAEN